ncbi:hypothetical protein ABPG74_004309 [Tetrahymena malaccensis]
MKIEKVRPNSNPVFNSITPIVSNPKDELVVTKQKRDAIINRLYEINQDNYDPIDFKNIQKIHENHKKTLKRQRSLPNKIVQDQDDQAGLKYPIDRSLFGFKETIYFQIPSSLSLIGSYKCFIYFGGFLWFYFLLFGIVTLGLALSNTQVSLRYDNNPKCSHAQNQQCTIDFEVLDYLKAPVHIYYSLGTFYQNHFQYQDSIVYEQLRGENVELSILKEKCHGALYNQDMFPSGETPTSFGANILDPQAVAFPCGMASKYVFNDYFDVYSLDNNSPPDQTPIEIDRKGIALKVDIEDKFQRIPYADRVCVRDVQQESFMNWINTPTLPVWKKLYGTILTNMVAGKYRLVVTNNFDSNLGTEKTLYFQTANSVGGKNVGFGIVLIITSVVFLVGTVYLILHSRKNKVQQEFDPRDLSWD